MVGGGRGKGRGVSQQVQLLKCRDVSGSQIGEPLGFQSGLQAAAASPGGLVRTEIVWPHPQNSGFSSSGMQPENLPF